MCRYIRPGFSDRLLHDAKDVQASLPGLFQRLGHDLSVDARNLNVHLQRRDAFVSAGDFKVHVTIMVLCARDVR